MRYLMVVLLVAGCANDAPAMPDAGADAAPHGAVQPAPCTDFITLESRYWRRELPYVEPVNGRIFVAGTFYALDGQSDPQSDGTTLLWASRVYHFEDEATQLGAAGSRAVGDTICEWAVPVRVE